MDRSLAPPPDSEQMTITVKVPKELKSKTLEVMYRSSVCKRVTHGASGQRVERDGYYGYDMQLERQVETDLYTARLPMDGGGACQWRLSNVMFGVVYADPSRFGEKVTWGTGGGVVVKFDHNRAPRSSGFPIEVDGNLTIRKDYYPWLYERFIGGYERYVSLVGEGGIYVVYQAMQARKVHFEPVLHRDYVVRSVGPKVKKDGNYTAITYPDGSFVADGRAGPDFLKLQSIRLSAEGKQ